MAQDFESIQRRVYAAVAGTLAVLAADDCGWAPESALYLGVQDTATIWGIARDSMAHAGLIVVSAGHKVEITAKGRQAATKIVAAMA